MSFAPPWDYLNGDPTNFCIIGKTQDGQFTVSGAHVFWHIDTNGIPLSVILDFYKSKNLIPDWLGFVLCATQAGWRTQTVTARILEAVSEVWGRDSLPAVRERLVAYLGEDEVSK